MSILINQEELNKFNNIKILEYDQAIMQIANIKNTGKTIGLCHGGFDLLHPGHMKHFESAKKICDVLFVSVTADKYVSSRKGSGRPVFNEKLRAYSIACLECVDHVVITEYEKAIQILEDLKPSYYIKGPDFIHKTTPGITAEREAITRVGGVMKYTDDPKLSTTDVIGYVKNKLDRKKILLGIDRDGTIIKDADFLGQSNNWQNEIEFNKEVIDFIIYLQTKYDTNSIIISNQGGVARNLFDKNRVEDIHKHLDSILHEKNIKIDAWEYCPDVDKKYAESQTQLKFNPEYIKEKTKRKPSPDMLFDGLKKINSNIADYAKIIIIGDRHEDKGLADAMGAIFVDVKNKSYDELISQIKNI